MRHEKPIVVLIITAAMLAVCAAWASAQDVRAGKTFWGLTDGEWGQRTGAGGPALIPSNIRAGVTGTYRTGWSLHTDTTNYVLYTVAIAAPDDVWAAGHNGEIYHYDGHDWSFHSSVVTGKTVLNIDMLGAGNGWAVGRDGYIYFGNE